MHLLVKQRVVITLVISLLLVIYFGFSLFVSYTMTSRLSPHLDISPNFISTEWRAVEFKSSDGIRLRGWFFESSSDKAIIMAGGLLANRTNTEYMGPIIAKELIENGYNVLLYDTRAHSKSDGDRVGFGSVEGGDIIGAVKFLNEQSIVSKNIGIIADSTGATSILMVIDKLKEVGAVVLDSPAADFQPIISNRLSVEKQIPAFFHPTIFFFNKLFFGVILSIVKPIDKISLDPNRKFLFLHGKLDETIPITNSEKLLEKAKKQSKLVVFEEGGHIETFKSDPDLYRKEVYRFLETELNN